MKNFLKIACAICLLFVFTATQAQIKFGPTVGLNLSTMTLKTSGLSIDPKTLVGFNVGLVSEFPLSETIALQPAFLFSTKGSKYSVMSESMTISPSFLEIPINVVYKFGASSLKFFVEAGPYFALGIGGKTESNGESVKIDYGSGESHDMKPFDFGLNVGAGVDFNGLLVSIHYGFGLTNLAPITTNNTEMKVKVIGISLTYLMGAK